MTPPLPPSPTFKVGIADRGRQPVALKMLQVSDQDHDEHFQL